MSWLLDFWDEFSMWLPALLVLGDILLTLATIVWILTTKTNSTSAAAWCLLVIFLPYFGAIFFFLFGYQHIRRPLLRKIRHKSRYRQPVNPASYDDSSHNLEPRDDDEREPRIAQQKLAHLASRFGAGRVTGGNRLAFYDDGPPAFAAMLEAIGNARHHVHLEFFIFQPDILGRRVLDLLTAKAHAGVQVRLLYDAMGSRALKKRHLKDLRAAGGQAFPFLPLNPWRRRVQINMRNHRKIVVVDGAVGFLGGLNIGDEYDGRDSYYGYWRDTHLRIEGPAVWDLQRIFAEDWSFAAEIAPKRVELALSQAEYFQVGRSDGPYALQIIDSGPDRDLKGIREIVFAAIMRARRRVWIASPYFIPDEGLLDALRLAAFSGVDVRVLVQYKADYWVPQYAARFYWAQVLEAGVRIYQYARGMMHAKVIIVDDDWATVGTANFDNRSMYLNFEANCLMYSVQAVRELEAQFRRDFEHSICLDKAAFAARPFPARLLENACRLLSPIL